MDAALIAFLACIATSTGGRAAQTLAALMQAHGRSPALLVTAIASSLAATAVMALLGAELASHVIGQPRGWIVAGALLLAAVELAIPVRPVRLQEPSLSLGAAALVLFARQLPDAPRLCVFAAAAALANPLPSLAGGGLASVAAIVPAWVWLEKFLRRQKLFYFIRMALAAILLGTALLIASIAP